MSEAKPCLRDLEDEFQTGGQRVVESDHMKNRIGKTLSVATVNRELSTMRAMLNEAMVNDWILTDPFKRVRPGELISIAWELQIRQPPSDFRFPVRHRCATLGFRTA